MADDRQDQAVDLDQVKVARWPKAPNAARFVELTGGVARLRLAASIRSRRLSASAAALGENQPHRPLMICSFLLGAKYVCVPLTRAKGRRNLWGCRARAARTRYFSPFCCFPRDHRVPPGAASVLDVGGLCERPFKDFTGQPDLAGLLVVVTQLDIGWPVVWLQLDRTLEIGNGAAPRPRRMRFGPSWSGSPVEG